MVLAQQTCLKSENNTFFCYVVFITDFEIVLSSEEVLEWPASLSINHCNNCTSNCHYFLLVKVEEPSECSVNLDYSDVPTTLA